MSDTHDVSCRKSDEEFKEAVPPEAVGGVPTDTSREQEATPEVGGNENESEKARLREIVHNAESKLEENRIKREALMTELTELEGGCFGRYLIESVYAFILVVTVGGWAVLGFPVWLPLLVRTTTLLAGSVFYASLFRDQPRMLKGASISLFDST